MAQPFVQLALDEVLKDALDQALDETTFVVVDLETTGGTAADGGITEIGAVRCRGGEPLGEFATLVNPGRSIPPYITVLTGITDAMLAPAPDLPQVLPAFLEFARGAVWVAHNAPYDLGYLRSACERLGYRWPRPTVLDTAALARRALPRDEVADHRLATLAAHFRTRAPTHRALDDARATIDVLHALFGRLGGHRVRTVREVIEFCRAVSPVQRAKRHLAQDLPAGPGVYIFRGRDDRPLYVGTSGSISTRVRSYFTAAEKRARIVEMLGAADRVEAIECAHVLEAEVRELRLIAAHRPPYNRRSKFPERTHWIRLTDEGYPRLSVVRAVQGPDVAHLGPFRSQRSARLALDALYEALPLRQCSTRLSTRLRTAACILAELGRCPAPCQHDISVEQYAIRAAGPFRAATRDDVGPLVEVLSQRIKALAAASRFEDAAVLRSRLGLLLRATIRMQRLAGLSAVAQLVAARRAAAGGWELAVIRHGRLVAAGMSAPGVHPRATVELLVSCAETVHPGPGPTPCASAEETERLLSWLEREGTRLVQTSHGWALPANGAARFTELLDRIEQAAARPFAQHQRPDRVPVTPIG